MPFPNGVSGFDEVFPQTLDICFRKLSFDSKMESEKRDGCFYEMEARFGKRQMNGSNSRFYPGVDAQFFFAVEQMLSQGEWDIVHKWTSIVDYFHKPHQVTTNQLSQYDSLRISNIDGNKQKHVAKKTIERSEFVNIGDSNGGFDLKISLAQEIDVYPNDLIITDRPSLVRIKHRKSYFLRERISKDKDIWLRFRYDLTCVWEDESKPKAEDKLMREVDTIYEIELEFEGLEPATLADKKIAEYATFSFLSKLSDLVSMNSSFKVYTQTSSNRLVLETESNNDVY